MAKAKKGKEWVGGVVAMPPFPSGEGGRSAGIFWVSGDGMILGADVVDAQIALERAAEHFRQTTMAPMVGKPHVPARVRVAQPELAEVLSAAFADLEVVVAPTPEIDDVLATMLEHMEDAGDEDDDDGYLVPGLAPEVMGRFFTVAARLYRAAPWDSVPGDANVLGVRIPSLGPTDGVLSIVGQLKESFGFALFSSVEDFQAYLEFAETLDGGDVPALAPRHTVLSFETSGALSERMHEEIATHGWEVAGPAAFPAIMVIDPDMVGRGPTLDELARVEAVAAALVELVQAEPKLRRVLSDDRPLERTLEVSTCAGAQTITLSAPLALRAETSVRNRRS